MKIVRHSIAPALSLLLGLGSAACQPNTPAGTSNPPGEGGNGAAAADDAGDDGAMAADSGAEGMAGDDGAAGGEGGQAGGIPKDCEAKVAEAPTPLFNDTVLIRPPVNVELVEDNPTFATTYATSGFVSACDATVDRMSLVVFPSDKKKKLATYMDEVINDFLSKGGFENGKRGENFVDTDNELHTAVEYPPAGGMPPAKLYVALSRKYDYVLATIFQTRPQEFPVLQPSFQKSAQSLVVVPPS